MAGGELGGRTGRPKRAAVIGACLMAAGLAWAQSQYATTTLVTSPAGTSTVGASVSLSASVTSPGGPTPTGSVILLDNGSTACSATLTASGTGSCSYAFTTTGVHSVTARYPGDGSNAPSDNSPQGPVSQTVNASTTTTTIVSSANPATASAGLKLTATVSGYTPTGTVKFADNGTAISGATSVPLVNGVASLTLMPVNAGGHNYKATYQPGSDTNNLSSIGTVAVSVVGATSTTTAGSTAGQQVTPTTSFQLTASVSGQSPSGNVTWYDGGVKVVGPLQLTNGAVQSTPLTLSSLGLHSIVAVYDGDTTNQGSSSTAYMIQVSSDGSTAPTGAAMQWTYQYDAQGNVTHVTDPKATTTDSDYDSLYRTTKITQPVPAAGASAPTIGIAYDLRDQPAAVTDPRSLQTSYTTTGLGTTTQITSPDAGPSTLTYYDNGLLKTNLDARGKTATYTYDALNRLKTISYDSGTGTTFTYDDPNARAVGLLSSFTDESGSTNYTYDGFSHIVSKAQTVVYGTVTRTFSVGYDWSGTGAATGKLQSITYPSGAQVIYAFDSTGRVSGVSVKAPNGTITQILTGMSYNAMGVPQSWAWSDGVGYQRTFDSYGRLQSYPLGNPSGTGYAAGVKRTVLYDASGRIVGYVHSGAGTATNPDLTFGYDNLDHLTSALGGGTSPTSFGYTYDATGNRTSTTVGGTTYTDTVSATSNRYTNVQNANGSFAQSYTQSGGLQNDGVNTFTYSARGRLQASTFTGGTAKYLYNALEQRVVKGGPSALIGNGGRSYYVYDEAGHLLGEYNASGTAQYETVYIGDIPVAVLMPSGTTGTKVYFAYPDHINTVRVIAGSGGAHGIVWTWGSNEPFGQAQPVINTNLVTSTFFYNPRMPGQVADVESGWFYNWHRDYNPALGRYVQSDPIGIRGGKNTYGYVLASPLFRWDALGEADSIDDSIASAIIRRDVAALNDMIESGGLTPAQEATAQQGLHAIDILKNGIQNESQLAKILGRSRREIEDAIHACKNKMRSKAMRQRNPDVIVDPRNGEVYFKFSDGQIGDSIGNLLDYLP